MPAGPRFECGRHASELLPRPGVFSGIVTRWGEGHEDVEMLARAFWTVASGRGEVRGETLPVPGADEVLVEAAWSAVSRGTEALVFNGRVPKSEFLRMRCPLQVGDFPAP